MPKFFYVAKDEKGEAFHGDMDASDQREVVESLRKEGKWIVSLKQLEEEKKTAKAFGGGSFFGVPLKNKMMFCRHLGVMISSGLSISRALNILSNQEKNPSFKNVIKEISGEVKKGVGMGDAMNKYPAVFNAVFVSMVRVGELSGNLEEILGILADQMEKDYKLVSKVRGALIYPAIIISLMTVLGILMMMFVVPKITAIFTDFDAELPPLTQAIITISDFMAANSWSVLGGIVAAIVGIRFFSKTELGRKIFHKFFLKAPVLGPIVLKVNSARFSRILSSLLNSGVSLVDSLKITADTLGNYYYKKACLQAAEDVQKGVPLSQVLFAYRHIFPYLVIQMIEVGEETGKTPDVLIKLAFFYEEEVDQTTKNLSSVIEPVLMVVIGAAVGFFAVAIIQPIYSIMNKI